MRLILGAFIGAVAGFAVGYFGRCTSGACPLTSNPYLAAFFGAVCGLLAVSGG